MAGYLFEWDAAKAAANQRKHGVTFDEAITAFSDPLALLLPDPEHSIGEQRYLVLGTSTQGRLLVIAVAERPPRIRLISARRATRMERRQYEEEEG
jgi:uncharacterized DUF497 family protein